MYGAPSPKTGTKLRLRFGDTDDQTLGDVATDSSGQSVLVGWFGGTIDFGAESITTNGISAFVIKLNADGGYLWSHEYGGGASTTVEAYGVAIDSAGNVVITGQFEGSGDFGSAMILSDGVDGFIAQLEEAIQ